MKAINQAQEIFRLCVEAAQAATGEPTKSGYDVPDWRKDAEKVFAQKEWPKADAIDWDYVWENRKVLSDTYGTRGYW